MDGLPGTMVRKKSTQTVKIEAKSLFQVVELQYPKLHCCMMSMCARSERQVSGKLSSDGAENCPKRTHAPLLHVTHIAKNFLQWKPISLISSFFHGCPVFLPSEKAPWCCHLSGLVANYGLATLVLGEFLNQGCNRRALLSIRLTFPSSSYTADT